jgi:hypothetical protein
VRGWTRPRDSAFVAALCERPLRTAAHEQSKPPYQIALTTCERCERATQDAGGRVMDVSPTVVERARCDAEHIGHLDAAATEPTRTAIPSSIRRRVLRRDHHRCQVPGCGGARWLEVHHIVPREVGGTHDPANLVTLCGAHHRAHHEGRLGITGAAPDGLRFERRDGSVYGDDFFAQAKSALRNLGWRAAVADAAVERVRAHVGTGDPLGRNQDSCRVNVQAASAARSSVGCGLRVTTSGRDQARGFEVHRSGCRRCALA